MPVRASIDPLEWENRFFAVNSAIVRFDEHAPRLTPEALAGWSRVQAKIAASDTVRLDALQRLGFQLVEGEVESGAAGGQPCRCRRDVAVEADIAPLREQAAQAFAMSRFPRALVRCRRQRPLLCPVDSKCGARHLRSSVPDLPPSEGRSRAFVSLPRHHRPKRVSACWPDAAPAQSMQAARYWLPRADFLHCGGDPDGRHRRA